MNSAPSVKVRPPRVEIVLRVEFESADQFKADFLSNLSSGGMFVRTAIPFEVGQVVSLQLSLPGVIEPPTSVEAEVRWLSANRPDFLKGVGLAFRNLPAALKQRLEGVLTEVAAVPHAEPSALRAVNAALLVNNPILQQIICGELERLARGGPSYRPATLTLKKALNVEACMAHLAEQNVDVVIADCEGLGLPCAEVVSTLRATPRTAGLSVIFLRGADAQPVPMPANDTRTVVLRKPVGMKSLYTTLLALSASSKRPAR